MEKRLLSQTLNPELMLAAKRMGFSDVMIGTLADRLTGAGAPDAPRMGHHACL